MHVSFRTAPTAGVATRALVLKKDRAGNLTKVNMTPTPKLLHHSAFCNSCPLVGYLSPCPSFCTPSVLMIVTPCLLPYLVLEEMCTRCFLNQGRYIKLQTENTHIHLSRNIFFICIYMSPINLSYIGIKIYLLCFIDNNMN